MGNEGLVSGSYRWLSGMYKGPFGFDRYQNFHGHLPKGLRLVWGFGKNDATARYGNNCERPGVST